MKPTSILGARGFFGRSLDEFKRLSSFALSGKSVNAPFVLKSFHDANSIEDCKVFSDQQLGGFSREHMDWIPGSTEPDPPPSENNKGHARFYGTINIDLPPSRPDIQRSGYAAWRTKDRGATIFGQSVWDIDPYAFLALRIKSDGRKYFVNLQTDSIVATDIHQHRLYARKPGEWETVLIKWSDFVRTNHGLVVEPQQEMLGQQLRTVGIGLIDRIPGPFDLSIERIWATNALSESVLEEDERLEEGQLKSRHGENIKIRWNEDKATKQ